MRLWDAVAGIQVGTLPERPGKVLSLSFCGPDRLAAGGSDNLIRVWDLASQTEQVRLIGHTGSVGTLAWDAQRGQLVSGSFDTTVRIWQLWNGGGYDAVSRRQ